MQTNLLKPKAIQVEQLGHNRAKVTLEPFERGYGHTLGNALRRVLLSSMVGYAVTDVTIAGVLHEYSSIDGVQEDVVNILLNLKGVVFKLHNRDEVTLSLRKEGEGQVTAADIQTPHDVEIINPEHVIANLSHGGKVDIQLKVEKGRGYVPGSMRRHADEVNKSIGRIVLDASFSPVKRVSYSVENARVEQRTDLDRLVVEIETNGAINAEDAVRSSAKILVEHWRCLPNLKAMNWLHLMRPHRAVRSNSILYCCALSMNLNSRFARLTASKLKTFSTSVTSSNALKTSCSKPPTWAASRSTKSRKFWPLVV